MSQCLDSLIYSIGLLSGHVPVLLCLGEYSFIISQYQVDQKSLLLFKNCPDYSWAFAFLYKRSVCQFPLKILLSFSLNYKEYINKPGENLHISDMNCPSHRRGLSLCIQMFFHVLLRSVLFFFIAITANIYTFLCASYCSKYFPCNSTDLPSFPLRQMILWSPFQKRGN